MPYLQICHVKTLILTTTVVSYETSLPFKTHIPRRKVISHCMCGWGVGGDRLSIVIVLNRE